MPSKLKFSLLKNTDSNVSAVVGVQANLAFFSIKIMKFCNFYLSEMYKRFGQVRTLVDKIINNQISEKKRPLLKL